ncbi:MAG: hypothetical protein ABFC96_02265 [Thermoguttaceae bacterium]
MKPWQFSLVVFCLLATAGCRTDPGIAMLERDNRRLEQEVWRLRGCIEDLRDELGSCQSRMEASRSAPGGGGLRRSDRALPAAAPETPDQPAIEMPSQPGQGVPDELKRPVGRRAPATEPSEHPSPATEPGGPTFDVPGPGGEESPHGPSGSPGGASFTPSDPAGDSRQVSSIALDPRMTGCITSADGQRDEGLLVVVQPRDDRGRPIDAPAEISVVAYDPAVQDRNGHAVLVARWDYTAEETAALLRGDGGQQAIHLAGSWGQAPPKHDQLHVFVRYQTADGRKIETDRRIEVALPNDSAVQQTSLETVEEPPQPARRDARRSARGPAWSPERR